MKDKNRYDQKAVKSIEAKWAKEIKYMLSHREFFSNRWAHKKWGDWLFRDQIKEGQKVCECGCFLGIPSIFLSLTKPGAKIYAFDISTQSMLKSKHLCNILGASVNLFASDFGNLPFESDSIDWMFGFGVLHHCHFKETFEEIERVLSAGGKALFIEPHRLNPLIRFYRKIRREPYSETEHPYDYEMLREIKKWVLDLETSWAFEHFFSTFLVLIFTIFKNLRRYSWWLSFYRKVQRILGKLDDVLLLHLSLLNPFSQYVVVILQKK